MTTRPTEVTDLIDVVPEVQKRVRSLLHERVLLESGIQQMTERKTQVDGELTEIIERVGKIRDTESGLQISISSPSTAPDEAALLAHGVNQAVIQAARTGDLDAKHLEANGVQGTIIQMARTGPIDERKLLELGVSFKAIQAAFTGAPDKRKLLEAGVPQYLIDQCLKVTRKGYLSVKAVKTPGAAQGAAQGTARKATDN